MIFIRRGQTNRVPLTLNELLDTSPADFLFEFTCDMTGVNYQRIFSATDISTATERYNLFMITETDTEDLYDGKVKLYPPGQWSYVIYEMPPLSPPSLDKSLAIKVLETGKVHVKEDTTPLPVFDQTYKKNSKTFE